MLVPPPKIAVRGVFKIPTNYSASRIRHVITDIATANWMGVNFLTLFISTHLNLNQRLVLAQGQSQKHLLLMMEMNLIVMFIQQFHLSSSVEDIAPIQAKISTAMWRERMLVPLPRIVLHGVSKIPANYLASRIVQVKMIVNATANWIWTIILTMFISTHLNLNQSMVPAQGPSQEHHWMTMEDYLSVILTKLPPVHH